MMQLGEHGEQRQSDLIKVFGPDSSTVTKTLQRMEQAGFVSRGRAELDRRIVLVAEGPRRPAGSAARYLRGGVPADDAEPAPDRDRPQPHTLRARR
ncbi:MarR family transcriptional regulator [Streptomyces sp. NPDC005890]|uniref:MarR family transcriptional regulator n=1 Tax=Streptomyces sp. NPDC005890 TaxID=3154568 RepID=UPI003401D07D